MNDDHRLLVEVRRFLAGLGLPLDGIVVAVSGGPDSVALLQALLAVRGTSARPRLVIAHLNHLLRGAESDADEEFVRQLHSRLLSSGVTDLEWRCERIDVAGRAVAEGGNREEAARRVRYEWLTQVAVQSGCRWLATGHTADDQGETVLHRLLRGTGLQGLRGIAPRRRLTADVELIRPMLSISRGQVLAFLDHLGQAFRQDSSNLDPGLTRNRIRHELLPLLAREYNPAIVSLLGQLACQADEVYRFIEDCAAQLLREVELPRAGGRLIFDRSRLEKAPRHLVREAFRLAWVREGWPSGGMTFTHWDRLAAVALGELPAVDLPDHIHARGHGRVVQLGLYE